MGRELLDTEPSFRSRLFELDALARQIIGQSILAELFDDCRRKSDPFDGILVTSAAIFMTEIALVELLSRRRIVPNVVVGASLGSFAAAVVSGCLDWEHALTAVIKQATIFEEHCRPGGMTAVVADDAFLHDLLLGFECEAAAFNGPSCFTISGPLDSLAAAEGFMRSRQVPFERLPVPYAFHSRWIDNAEGPLRAYFAALSYKTPQIPLVCCTNTSYVAKLDAAGFWEIARHPVRFEGTIEFLETHGPHLYIDLGPSGSLATVLKHILRPNSASDVGATLSPFGSDSQRVRGLL
jgi:acyl transferase domain-containing protein